MQSGGDSVLSDPECAPDFLVRQLFKCQREDLPLSDWQPSNRGVQSVALPGSSNDAVGRSARVCNVNRWLCLTSAATHCLSKTDIVSNAQDVRLYTRIAAVPRQCSHNREGDLLCELLSIRTGWRVASNNSCECSAML